MLYLQTLKGRVRKRGSPSAKVDWCLFKAITCSQKQDSVGTCGGVSSYRMPSLSGRWVCKCQQVALSRVQLWEMWQGWAANAVQKMSRRPSYLNNKPTSKSSPTLSSAVGAPRTFSFELEKWKLTSGTTCYSASYWNIWIVPACSPCWH